jgi:hypothetical protein
VPWRVKRQRKVGHAKKRHLQDEGQHERGFVSKQMARSIYVKRLYPTDPKEEDKSTFDGIG